MLPITLTHQVVSDALEERLGFIFLSLEGVDVAVDLVLEVFGLSSGELSLPCGIIHLTENTQLEL